MEVLLQSYIGVCETEVGPSENLTKEDGLRTRVVVLETSGYPSILVTLLRNTIITF